MVRDKKRNLRVIVDQWPKLHLGLDVLSDQKILNGIFFVIHNKGLGFLKFADIVLILINPSPCYVNYIIKFFI